MAVTLRDIDVWKPTISRLILRYPDAKVIVCVPKWCIEDFRDHASNRKVEIRSEEEVVESQVIQQIKESARSRAGWYIQQFAKVSILISLRTQYNLALIWDSDSLPSRSLRLVSDEGIVLYGSSPEFHKPYFEQIQRALRIPKQVDESFITQYLPVKSKWIDALCHELGGELRFQQTLCDSIDFNQISGFSEYEMIGTFVKAQFPREFSRHPQFRMLRGGNRLLGGITRHDEILERNIARVFHVVAYEASEQIASVNFKGVIEIIHQVLRQRLYNSLWNCMTTTRNYEE